jgi:nucleotide-binding universal stress UspA family protein
LFEHLCSVEERNMFGEHRHILVPLDGSALAECVLPHAVALSRAFDAPITLLRVIERQTECSEDRAADPLSWQLRKTEAEAYLMGVATRLRELDLSVVVRTVEGQPAEQIVHFSEKSRARGGGRALDGGDPVEHEVGMIVLSSHGGSGLSAWNISSVVQKVILRAQVPTLIVRAYQPATDELGALRYRNLLMPLDGSQRAECVLPLALTIAHHHEAKVLAAHVVVRPEVPRRVPLKDNERELVEQLVALNHEEATDYLEDLSARLPCMVETRLLVADSSVAALQRLSAEEPVDLVLLSAHGYSGSAQWPYGSVALNFIAYGTTPLLMVQDLPESDGPPPRSGTSLSKAEAAVSESKGR